MDVRSPSSLQHRASRLFRKVENLEEVFGFIIQRQGDRLRVNLELTPN